MDEQTVYKGVVLTSIKLKPHPSEEKENKVLFNKEVGGVLRITLLE